MLIYSMVLPDVHPRDDFAEDNMLAIQVRRRGEEDEELRPKLYHFFAFRPARISQPHC